VEQQARRDVVTDTSILINFLNVDRLDLLARCSGYRFLVTEHVKREVTVHYPRQVERLDKGISSGTLVEIVVNSLEELETFAELSTTKRLGSGECAAIAAAAHRGLMLAIDDKQASKTARKLCKAHNVLDTVDLMVSFIKEGLLDIAEADSIKLAWETKYRFRLAFTSFQAKV
jgi:predicted nucleic acid-binding protein